MKVGIYAVAPPGIFIGGGAKYVGVWGRAPENFSLTTPSTLAINVTKAEIKINKSVEVLLSWYHN